MEGGALGDGHDAGEELMCRACPQVPASLRAEREAEVPRVGGDADATPLWYAGKHRVEELGGTLLGPLRGDDNDALGNLAREARRLLGKRDDEEEGQRSSAERRAKPRSSAQPRTRPRLPISRRRAMSLMNGSKARRKAREAAGVALDDATPKGEELDEAIGRGGDRHGTLQQGEHEGHEAERGVGEQEDRAQPGVQHAGEGLAEVREVEERLLVCDGVWGCRCWSAGCEVQLDHIGEEVAAGNEAALLRSEGVLEVEEGLPAGGSSHDLGVRVLEADGARLQGGADCLALQDPRGGLLAREDECGEVEVARKMFPST